MFHIEDEARNKTMIQDLRSWRLFSDFSENELKELMPLLEPEYLIAAEGETVVSVGDKDDRLYLVTVGLFEEQRAHSDIVHDIGRYKPGGFFGLYDIEANKKSPVNVVALRDGELLAVRMDKALDEPRFRERLLRALFNETRDLCVRLTYRVDILSAKGLRNKLMVYFQAMRDKHESNAFTIKMTQGELAEYLETDRANLSGQLKRMREEGFLRISGDNTYEILSWDAWTKKDKKA